MSSFECSCVSLESREKVEFVLVMEVEVGFAFLMDMFCRFQVCLTSLGEFRSFHVCVWILSGNYRRLAVAL